MSVSPGVEGGVREAVQLGLGLPLGVGPHPPAEVRGRREPPLLAPVVVVALSVLLSGNVKKRFSTKNSWFVETEILKNFLVIT